MVLEEVVVTAQKRVESLQDVALSVTAVSGEKISEQGLFNMQELAPYVTNFYQAKTPTFSVMTIRGLGSSPNPGFEQSAAMYNDGVYWGRGRQMVAPMFDLQRIEVLKGPQSILFGKNSIAGAVSIHSVRPTDELSGFARLLYGEDDEIRAEAAVSGSLTENLRGRVSVFRRDIDGWIDNDFSGDTEPSTENQAFRMMLDYSPIETMVMTLKYEESSVHTEGANYEITQATLLPGNPPDTPAVVPPHLVGQEDKINYKSKWGNSAPLPDDLHTDMDLRNAFFNIDLDVGEHTLTLLTGYSDYEYDPMGDLDFTASSIIGATGVEDFDQWSQEIRFTSSTGNTLEYIAGAYYQNNTLDINNNIWFQLSEIEPPRLTQLANALNRPDLLNAIDGIRDNHFKQDSETWSAFAEVTWNISDRFRTTLGLRYTDETKDLDKSMSVIDYNFNPVDLDSDFVLAGIWEQGVDVVPYDVSRTRQEDDWSPSVKFEYNVTDDIMTYASWTRGFKGGGFDNNHSNGNNMADLEYQEEEAEAFELGSKMTMLDGRAELNAAVFYTTYDDLQVSIFNGTSGFLVTNAAEATSQGLELEGRFLISRSLMLTGNMAYLDFEFDDYANAQCTTAQNAQELVDTGSTDACAQDLTGDTANYAPEWAASISLQHTAELPANLELVSSLDINYRDEEYLAADLDSATKQDAITRLNMRIALIDVDRWELALIGKNLTDEESLSTSEDVPFGNGNFYGIPDYQGSFYGVVDRPRSFAVEGVIRF